MMAGVWHELAKALPQLAASGYDSAVVEMETGLERAQQSAWAVAQQASLCPAFLPFIGSFIGHR